MMASQNLKLPLQLHSYSAIYIPTQTYFVAESVEFLLTHFII